jgi:hypothetical protein
MESLKPGISFSQSLQIFLSQLVCNATQAPFSLPKQINDSTMNVSEEKKASTVRELRMTAARNISLLTLH